jgi:hypothetical protein
MKLDDSTHSEVIDRAQAEIARINSASLNSRRFSWAKFIATIMGLSLAGWMLFGKMQKMLPMQQWGNVSAIQNALKTEMMRIFGVELHPTMEVKSAHNESTR